MRDIQYQYFVISILLFLLLPFNGFSAKYDSVKMSNKPTVPELLTKSKDEIVSFLGDIYEHSSWVAEEFYMEYLNGKGHDHGIENARDLFRAMNSIMEKSSDERKLALLRAHPDLCAKIDQLKTLTKSSQEEQSSAGLGSMTGEERDRFSSMNASYREKFGFPFILAARNATKFTVLSAIEGRLNLSKQIEYAGALFQVSKIAWMRLLAAFDLKGRKGFLTCIVLDTGNGCPAEGMRVVLNRISPPEKAGFVKEFYINSGGRLDGPALKDDEFIVGVYEWTFYAGDYFARSNTKISGMPFLDVIPLRFGIDDPEEHYHVPLLVSPWSYSTCRGS